MASCLFTIQRDNGPFDEYGYDSVRIGFELRSGAEPQELSEALQTAETALRPAPPAVVSREILALRMATASRNTEPMDTTGLGAVYAEELGHYPGPAFVAACRFWRRNEKWWPTISELTVVMERMSRPLFQLRDALAAGPRRPAAPEPEEPPPPPREPTEAEKAEIAKRAAEAEAEQARQRRNQNVETAQRFLMRTKSFEVYEAALPELMDESSDRLAQTLLEIATIGWVDEDADVNGLRPASDAAPKPKR